MEVNNISCLLKDMGKELEKLNMQYSLKVWTQYTEGLLLSTPDLDRQWNAFYSQDQIFRSIVKEETRTEDDLLKRELNIWKNEFIDHNIMASPQVLQSNSKLRQVFREFYSPANRKNYWEISISEPRRSVRRQAWEERVELSVLIRDEMQQMLVYLNNVSNIYGFSNYMEYCLHKAEISKDSLMNLINAFEQCTRGLAYDVVNEMKENLKVETLEPWDLEYGKYIYTKELQTYFRADNAVDILKKSCSSFGFLCEQLPISIDYEKRANKISGCYTIPIKIPDDIRLLLTPMPGDRFYENLFHEYGHALHNAHRYIPQYAFKLEAQCFSEAMAAVLSSVLYDGNWLESYLHMKPEQIHKYQLSRRYWLYLLRISLSYAVFEIYAYDNPLADLDKIFWDIYEKFSLIPGKYEESFWASSALLCTHPGYLFNYFAGELIAAQVVHGFCSKEGSILNNNKFSQYLAEEFYVKGNSISWLEKIRHATGEDLHVKYLLK